MFGTDSFLVNAGVYAAAIVSITALLTAAVRLIRRTGQILDRIDTLEKQVTRLDGVVQELVRHELRRNEGDPP